MATKRALFAAGNGADSSPKKKGRGDGKLLSVKQEKEAQNGADEVEVGSIIRARYGTTNSETYVGEQACFCTSLFVVVVAKVYLFVKLAAFINFTFCFVCFIHS